MNVQAQISDYLAAQPERKRADMQTLHEMMSTLVPDGRLWFLDGRDESGRTVANPNIGYGRMTMDYANGRTREFYQIGLSGWAFHHAISAWTGPRGPRRHCGSCRNSRTRLAITVA